MISLFLVFDRHIFIWKVLFYLLGNHIIDVIRNQCFIKAQIRFSSVIAYMDSYAEIYVIKCSLLSCIYEHQKQINFSTLLGVLVEIDLNLSVH